MPRLRHLAAIDGCANMYLCMYVCMCLQHWVNVGEDKKWRRPLISAHYKILWSRLKGIKRDGAQLHLMTTTTTTIATKQNNHNYSNKATGNKDTRVELATTRCCTHIHIQLNIQTHTYIYTYTHCNKSLRRSPQRARLRPGNALKFLPQFDAAIPFIHTYVHLWKKCIECSCNTVEYSTAEAAVTSSRQFASALPDAFTAFCHTSFVCHELLCCCCSSSRWWSFCCSNAVLRVWAGGGADLYYYVVLVVAVTVAGDGDVADLCCWSKHACYWCWCRCCCRESSMHTHTHRGCCDYYCCCRALASHIGILSDYSCNNMRDRDNSASSRRAATEPTMPWQWQWKATKDCISSISGTPLPIDTNSS